ncbi:zinc finger protein 135-like [Takifugu rubripes]|uniref:Zinc finger protein 135-like n=1 Tax=Takifugu rubripes TaxID=31033 RepID=A0A3B5K701_TAKRU|nr:zinc finger protein 135-like [Takifugu rubripes]|eukprot:XP_011608893.1 PREDICTED: zinc finger protein 135-like [Takifugu rubripes]
MSIDMRPGSVDLETQLLSIMDVLVKTAVTEIRQLFSENSASLCVQLSQSLRENETLRTRMSIMRSELFSLRLQNRNNRPSSRFSHLRGNVTKPRAKQKVFIKLPVAESAVRKAASGFVPRENEPSTNQTRQGDPPTADVILIKDEDDIEGCGAVTGQKDIGHKSQQVDGGGAGSLDLQSSCLPDTGKELKILSVHGRGEGPLQDIEDGLVSASELTDFSSLSSDHNATHEGLQNFPNQVENQSTQMAPAVEEMPFFGTASQMGHPSYVSQFLQHPDILTSGVPQGRDCSSSSRHFLSPEDTITHGATHMSRNPCICPYCGKSFIKKSSLNIHLRIHTGEKPYACMQCGKRFTHSGSLKIHLRTHSGEKPYTCRQCSARFGDLSNLRRHVVTHGTSGEYQRQNVLFDHI